MGKILLMVVLLGVSIQNYAQYGTRGVKVATLIQQ